MVVKQLLIVLAPVSSSRVGRGHAPGISVRNLLEFGSHPSYHNRHSPRMAAEPGRQVAIYIIGRCVGKGICRCTVIVQRNPLFN